MSFTVSFNGLNGQDATKLDPLLSSTFGPLMEDVSQSQEISQNLRLDAESHKEKICTKLAKFEETATLTQRAFLEFSAKGAVNILEKKMRQLRELMSSMRMPTETFDKGLEKFQDAAELKKTKEVIKAYLIDQIGKEESKTEVALQGLKQLKADNLVIEKTKQSVNS